MEIRRALPTEADELTRITQASKQHWQYPQAYLDLWNSLNLLTISVDYVVNHPVFVAVGKTHGTDNIMGYCACAGTGQTQELDNLFVSPAYIGQGVGQALLLYSLAYMRQQGARAVRIVSDPHAVAFYQKFGARHISDVPSLPEGRQLPLLQIDLEAIARDG
ncbi:MAG: GNAT family N-acetyltransferase [Anaerolineales bacterium]|nr:GNAT family N-acetyltransferase [Anaerolineales bacterium]MCB8952633.1 GNAT family N-acetyltransferase [Ardenticatenales bacterium]